MRGGLPSQGLAENGVELGLAGVGSHRRPASWRALVWATVTSAAGS